MSKNTNCLEGCKCPSCGQEDRFLVSARAIFDIRDGGTDNHGDVEYGDSDFAECTECKWVGTWGQLSDASLPQHPAAQSEWVPKSPGAKYPEDSVRIVDAKDDYVSFSRQGGGMIRGCDLGEFLSHFTQVTDAMKGLALIHRPAFFSFDDGPTILGFTLGHRWNGWGSPCLELESFRKWIKAMDQELGAGSSAFRVDGCAVYLLDYNADDEPEEFLEPYDIEFEGRTYTVVSAQCGLTWNQVDPDDAHADDDSIEGDGRSSAVSPEGMNPEDYIN